MQDPDARPQHGCHRGRVEPGRGRNLLVDPASMEVAVCDALDTMAIGDVSVAVDADVEVLKFAGAVVDVNMPVPVDTACVDLDDRESDNVMKATDMTGLTVDVVRRRDHPGSERHHRSVGSMARNALQILARMCKHGGLTATNRQ